MGYEKIHCEAPDAERVPKEMAGFWNRFNSESDMDPVLKAALAHFWFITGKGQPVHWVNFKVNLPV
jgi:Fic family protein